MLGMESIRSALESTAGHLAEHPDAGAGPDAPATAVRVDGLRCRVTGPSGEVTTDMATALGGSGSGPSPGWLLRGALASCNATIIAMEAARAGIELGELSVTVESVSDSRGVLGVGDGVPPGPLEVRVRIELTGDAGEDSLRELVERAEARSAVGDAIAREVSVTTEVAVQSRRPTTL